MDLLVISVLALIVVLVPKWVGAEPLTGKVVGITDGDTLTVLVDRQRIRIRLAEIDTPERGQPWGNRAKQASSEKAFGRVVELQVVKSNRGSVSATM